MWLRLAKHCGSSRAVREPNSFYLVRPAHPLTWVLQPYKKE
ncbi:hypothetical protein M7I_4747 [Glarea lozoyensis 74030]|uniref:Uncharacterized protein n=1 Tax=Glarea lozoyensis (strain ATCC 74030 / MF5533) TaxID=1104152 RepID=H0EQ06_GLAL7|nr:hypothetical protein M7I_4747 [Glarea lozoyensis 74030]